MGRDSEAQLQMSKNKNKCFYQLYLLPALPALPLLHFQNRKMTLRIAMLNTDTRYISIHLRDILRGKSEE